MTNQAIDTVHYQDADFVLIGISAPLPAPKDFGIRHKGGGTGCVRGYERVFKCESKQLLLEELLVAGRVIMDGSEYPNHGLVSDWNGPNRNRLFCDLPPVNGRIPEPEFFTIKGKTFRNGAEENFVEDRVRRNCYKKIALPLDFSGGIMLGTGRIRIWVGVPMPINFHRVLEMTFDRGELQTVIDASDTVSLLRQENDPFVATLHAFAGTDKSLIRFQHSYFIPY